MTLYIIIILVTVLILGILFGRKRSDEKSDYQPEQFRHSGHDWVFNGILDIDHPPHDDSPFHDYDQPIQLMVKKGYVHCDITIDDTVGERDLGLFLLDMASVAVGFTGITGYVQQLSQRRGEGLTDKRPHFQGTWHRG